MAVAGHRHRQADRRNKAIQIDWGSPTLNITDKSNFKWPKTIGGHCNLVPNQSAGNKHLDGEALVGTNHEIDSRNGGRNKKKISLITCDESIQTLRDMKMSCRWRKKKEDDRFISFAVVRMNEIPQHLATEYFQPANQKVPLRRVDIQSKRIN